jgi:DNA modification methylase
VIGNVVRGDCLAVMPTLDANSVDAIVCDPPYGLSFMGKNWDHGIPGVAFWAEALRVAKPGAHLVAFGGSRTFHRLACAIEDAGWEIRDTLSWLYGSGFPKSLDVSKALDKQRQDNPDWIKVGAWLKSQRGAAGISAKALCAAIGAHGEVNHGGAASNWENGFSCPTWEQWLAMKAAVGFGDEMDAEVWRLNGRKGQPGEAWDQREVIGEQTKARSEAGRSALPTMGAGVKYETWDVTAPATDAAKQWAGWGTALKPSHEPIILARKPLSGTVAATVTQWGTGAINVDACRIAGQPRTTHADGNRIGDRTGATGQVWGQQGATYEGAAGRWPANVVLSHAPECRQVGTRKVKGSGSQPRHNTAEAHNRTNSMGKATADWTTTGYGDADGTETVPAWECAPGCPVAMLDAQSGERPGCTVSGTKANKSGYHGFSPMDRREWYGDTGGAARFFLCVQPDAKHDSFSYIKGSQGGCSCGGASPKDESTSAGKRTASSGDNSPTDGSGNRPTDLSPKGTKSTTGTAINSTTPCPICSSSPQPSTTTCTDGSEATSSISAGSSTDAANGAGSTSPSSDSVSARLATITATASLALPRTSESGEQPTANTTTPTTAPIESGESSPRFFYTAKASRREREAGLEGMPQRVATVGNLEAAGRDPLNPGNYVGGEQRRVEAGLTPSEPRTNHHPTVKPLALMRWLCRLVTPPGGVILDPFTGSGSTGCAAVLEGFRFLGIEQEAEYVAIAERRIAHWAAQATPTPDTQTELEVA